MDIIKSQKQSQHQHDQFHGQLEKAEDGFSVVADYFGRGLFRKKEDNSPKRSTSKPYNPFGEDTEENYDQALNPFC